MLVVKLHKNRRFSLSAGTYYIPILSWEEGELFVKRWYKQLKKRQNIRYISLIKIPDDHPVFISMTPSAKTLIKEKYVPLKDIGSHEKEKLREWYEKFALQSSASLSTANLPELSIGDPLPFSQLKWTKDIKLLFESNTSRRKK